AGRLFQPASRRACRGQEDGDVARAFGVAAGRLFQPASRRACRGQEDGDVARAFGAIERRIILSAASALGFVVRR
ncbi:MAG: hypothetical protein AAF488_14590, partial [Planctomycetota bacterium]